MTLELIERLTSEAGKRGLEFLLIGGHAVNAHGYERTTLDFDFMVRAADLEVWKAVLSGLGYHPIHETKAFAQFEPVGGDGFRIDLMLVDAPTFVKLIAGSELVTYGGCRIRVAGVLHLIALKLHATRTWDRAVQGKDLSKNDCSATSSGLFDLNLPEVGVEEGPLPNPAPTFAAQMEHAMFLLSIREPDFYEKRLARMNPEPFSLA